MEADDVLAYLDSHPDFLSEHAQRYGLKPVQERVVSFADRQLLDLKDRNRQLEARLAQLVRHGEQNDQTLARTHKLSLALMKAATLSDVHAAILQVFAEHFGLNRVAVRLWHDAASDTQL